MKRRDFIRNAALGLGTAWFGGRTLSEAIWALPPLPQKFNASDTIVLGRLGLKDEPSCEGRERSASAVVRTRRSAGSRAFPGCF
jgi:hypothetical protein